MRIEKEDSNVSWVSCVAISDMSRAMIDRAQARHRVDAISHMAPNTMNGLRRPQDEWYRSDQLPNTGCNTAPHNGPEMSANEIWDSLRPRDAK